MAALNSSREQKFATIIRVSNSLRNLLIDLMATSGSNLAVTNRSRPRHSSASWRMRASVSSPCTECRDGRAALLKEPTRGAPGERPAHVDIHLRSSVPSHGPRLIEVPPSTPLRHLGTVGPPGPGKPSPWQTVPSGAAGGWAAACWRCKFRTYANACAKGSFSRGVDGCELGELCDRGVDGGVWSSWRFGRLSAVR